MDKKSFEKGLDNFLAGDLEEDQLAKLEAYAGTSSEAAKELLQVKQLNKLLKETALQHREQRCPVDLSKAVMGKVGSRKAPVFVRFRLAYAVGFVLVLVAASYHFAFRGQEKKVLGQRPVASLSHISSELNRFRQKNQQDIDSLSLGSLMSRTISSKETSFRFSIPSRPIFIQIQKIKTKHNERS